MGGNLLHSPQDHAFADLLTLGEADAILAMDLINATTTDAIMGVVLQEVTPGGADQAMGIRLTSCAAQAVRGSTQRSIRCSVAVFCCLIHMREESTEGRR